MKKIKAKTIYKYVFCLINSLILIFSLNYYHKEVDIFGTNSKIYFNGFKKIDLLVFIAAFLTFLLLFYLVEVCIKNNYKPPKIRISSKKLFLITIIILLFAWAPYYLTFFPGGIYTDTYNNFMQATHKITGKGFPIFYTLLLRLLYYICFKNTTATFGLLTIIQLALFIISFAYFIIKLKEYNVSKPTIILTIIFYAFYPRIPIYAISLWKDSLFSIFLFLYSIKLYDCIKSEGKLLANQKYIIIYSFLCILVSIFRNNSYIIIAIITIILFFKYKTFKNYHFFTSISTVTISCIIITYTIIFNIVFNYKIPYVEAIGIPLQQIGHVIANEDHIDTQSYEFLDNLIGVDNLKKAYHPLISDMIKFNKHFSNEYLESHKKEFWKTYFRLGKKYPINYIKAYLYSTVGFWDYYTNCFQAGTDSLIDYYEIAVDSKNTKDISNNINFLNKYFHLNISNKIYRMAYHLNNCAFGFLLVFISIYFLVYKKRMNRFIIYLPSLIIFITLMMATPIAYNSRYIIYIILFIPFSLIIPFIEN